MSRTIWWDVAAFTAATVTVILASIGTPFDAASWGVLACAVAFLAAHFGYARRHIEEQSARSTLIIALLYAAVIAVGCAFNPSFAILQAFVYPAIWFAAVDTRTAIIGNVAVAVAVVIGSVVFYPPPQGLVIGLGVALLSFGFSLALGLWITRIAEFGNERARLLAELQATQGELAALHRDAGVSSERERLAREIHDTIAQSLTGLVMLAERAERELAVDDAGRAVETVTIIESMAREALTEARSLVAAMAPVRVDSTLTDALTRLGERFERETGVRVTTAVSVTPLDRELEVVLLRCTQEALANVRKHARASAASVVISQLDAVTTLTVTDNGVGYVDGGSQTGFGISGMRERVAIVGGDVELTGSDPGGTVLTVSIPSRERMAT
ncbi:sensor histidine kinase [Glaciibacter flavus]|uniref:Sensor histidine kinase n=1 Tax=Orlajensenia flava TaxID=2565934 RepID=A0A4S4FGH6_9MICO|nr:sensor histidine kinase [Glaciibacter flavus]THG29088.1 sensor histidine kinase [Glaciibacter flavus]